MEHPLDNFPTRLDAPLRFCRRHTLLVLSRLLQPIPHHLSGILCSLLYRHVNVDPPYLKRLLQPRASPPRYRLCHLCPLLKDNSHSSRVAVKRSGKLLVCHAMQHLADDGALALRACDALTKRS